MKGRSFGSRLTGLVRRSATSLLQRRNRIAPRHKNPYATHLPVLCALAQMHTIRQVVEFGCGENSTLTFLNREVFPDLECLISLENDWEWRNRIQRRTCDPRLTMIPVAGKMAEAVNDDVLSGSQLILVDDSRSVDDRSATISAVASHLPDNCLLVIHDFEVPEYRAASAGLHDRFVSDALTPMTGVLSHRELVSRRLLASANRIIRRESVRISLNAFTDWREVFSDLYDTKRGSTSCE